MKVPATLQRRTLAAFSLLEVMIALAIFFMCVFSILALVSRSLAGARSLEPIHIDATSAIAELSLTNRLEEGPVPTEVIANFEAMHPGYTIMGEIYEVATNGLFRIDMVVGGVGNSGAVQMNTNSILLFRPLSAQGGFRGIRR